MHKPWLLRIHEGQALSRTLAWLMVLCLVISLMPGAALADITQPHWFWGNVTIGGAPAPEGTLVTAFVQRKPSLSYQTFTDADAHYGYDPEFVVPGDDAGIVGAMAGDIIIFKINGFDTGISTQFIVGGGNQPLHLDQPVPTDFGDAPDPTYPTLLASDGARHHLVPGLHLGALIDAELDGQPDATATGDDLATSDDEDGVVFTSPLLSGAMATVDVTASASGFLNAWLDANADGDWADAGEQIFVDRALTPGLNSLSFVVPATGVEASSFARFRFSSQTGLSYTGLALDGEVEDYGVALTLPEIGVDVSKVLVAPTEMPILTGDEIQFRVTVTNTGQIAFASNPITDTFQGMVFQSATQRLIPQGSVPLAIAPNLQNQLIWDMAVVNGSPILPGQVVVIEMSFLADAPGSAQNQVVVVEYDELGRSVTDQDVVDLEILAAPLTISATAGLGGSIDPMGDIEVASGADQTFAISADACFTIADVLVDGLSVGAVDSYTFSGVTTTHTIAAQFAPVPDSTIEATAGAGGSISPAGSVNVACGADQTFAISADACFTIADVLVDGLSVGAVDSYTFPAVTTTHTLTHTIVAQFAPVADWTIIATAGAGGSISPAGSITVTCGADQTFAISADADRIILDVLVDGASVGAVTSYTFEGVVANHTIEALFGQVPSEFAPSLPAGWNLFSTPVLLDASQDTLADIFVPAQAAKTQVFYAWDAENELFVLVSGAYELKPLDALFVKVAEGQTAIARLVPSTEISSPQKKALVVGLNLVGPAPAFDAQTGSFPAMAVNVAWSSIDQGLGGINGYTMGVSPALNQPGWVYTPGGIVQNLLAYKGYWVVMENPDDLYGFSQTPIHQ